MKLFLAAFGVSYVGLLLGWRGYRVGKQIGRNPLMLSSTNDDAAGFVVRTSRLLYAGIVLTGVIYCAAERTLYPYLLPIDAIAQSPWLRRIGYALCITSFAWIFMAQGQMGSSWRVGIDSHHRTALVCHGLFRVSRNPIFAGLIVSVGGVFLLIPNAVLSCLTGALVCLLQVQVRLEEAHLRALHGEQYEAYRRRVPRWGLRAFWRPASAPVAVEHEVRAGDEYVAYAGHARHVGGSHRESSVAD